MRKLLVFVALVIPAAAEAPPLELEKRIPLEGVHGRIDHMALSADGERLFIAALGNGSVEEVEIEKGRRLEPIANTAEPQGVIVLPKTGVVVVASGGDGKVLLVDPELDIILPFAELDDADNVRFDAASGLVYVGGATGELAVFEPKKGARVERIKLDGHPESFQLETRGDLIFVNIPTKKQVAVVDRKKRAVVSTWTLEGAESNFPMALDEAGGRLYVGCRRPAKILVFDTATGKHVTALDAPGDADDIFWDAPSQRLFVSGGDGTVAVFRKVEGEKFEAAPLTKTGAGARTSLLSPEGKRLFVAVPEKDSQKAEIRVYSVRPAAK